MKQGKIIELVIAGIPYPNQIRELDVDTEKAAIRFTWRGSSYRVSDTGHVEEVQKGMLIGSDKAILMSHLLAKTDILCLA